MTKITREDVLRLAALSKLSLSESEVEQFTKEFQEILGYVELLQDVDVSDLEPTSQVNGLTNVMRKDETHDYGVTAETLLQNLPRRKENLIKVKRVL